LLGRKSIFFSLQGGKRRTTFTKETGILQQRGLTHADPKGGGLKKGKLHNFRGEEPKKEVSSFSLW